MDDNAVVCGQCGTPFAGTNSTKISGINYQTPQSKQQKEKNKKTITLIIAAVVAVLVVIGAVRVISPSESSVLVSLPKATEAI